MANKLYEETHIQNIANAIRGKTGSTSTYKVSEMANAIESISIQTSDEKRLIFTKEITETTVGSGKYVALVKSDKLKEIRNEEKLFVRVEFDVEAAPYTIIKSWGFNSSTNFPGNISAFQYCLRWDGTGNNYNITSAIQIPISNNSTSGVGCLQLTEEGELRIYSNSSSNYAIRPSNCTIIIEW